MGTNSILKLRGILKSLDVQYINAIGLININKLKQRQIVFLDNHQ